MKKVKIMLTASVALLLFVLALAYGQTAASSADKPTAGNDQWTFSVIPYA